MYGKRTPRWLKNAFAFLTIVFLGAVVCYVIGLTENGTDVLYWSGYGLREVGDIISDVGDRLSNLGTYLQERSISVDL